ncbi:hypothetical protein TYRP_005579 [Tyrophagus putrescentiae]|nr:hypothetical protein TYRP_005579 [Tyrophagus putrescentiae]
MKNHYYKITSALRLVHCSKLPNFTSTTKVYLFKVPVTTTTTTSIRNRQQLSTVAISTETPSVSSAALITSQSVSISTSTSTPATFTPTCNYTEYPHSGCSPIFKASCDRETNSCICGTASTSNDKTDLQLGTNKFRNSRHRKRFCLNEAALGSVCQSSGQCRAVDVHSSCHSTSGDFTSWRCSCSVGFVEHDGVCHPAADPTQLVDPYSRCASVGQVYISSLDRCVDKGLMPFYANRGVGRAGGGRGGGNRGRGGVGTRTTGSRSCHTFPVMHYISFLVVAAAAVLVAGNYGHGGYHHKCYPKMTVKHHTVHVPVPYTVYEKYPVYKYEKYPVHVPYKVPVYVKVKEEKYHTGSYEHGGYHGGSGHDDYGHDEHYAAADEPQKKIAAPEGGKAKA